MRHWSCHIRRQLAVPFGTWTAFLPLVAGTQVFVLFAAELCQALFPRERDCTPFLQLQWMLRRYDHELMGENTT